MIYLSIYCEEIELLECIELVLSKRAWMDLKSSGGKGGQVTNTRIGWLVYMVRVLKELRPELEWACHHPTRQTWGFSTRFDSDLKRTIPWDTLNKTARRPCYLTVHDRVLTTHLTFFYVCPVLFCPVLSCPVLDFLLLLREFLRTVCKSIFISRLLGLDALLPWHCEEFTDFLSSKDYFKWKLLLHPVTLY